MNYKSILIGFTILILTNCSGEVRQTNNKVNIVGAMKNVMWKGQLEGNIYLDTIADKKNLYGHG